MLFEFLGYGINAKTVGHAYNNPCDSQGEKKDMPVSRY
jgi:hypothetical protein